MHVGSGVIVTTRLWWGPLIRDQGVMHLLRCLVFVEAQIGCQLYGVYIDIHSNHLADDLSWDNLFSFLSKMSASQLPPVPSCSAFFSTPRPIGYRRNGVIGSALFLATSTHRTYNAAMKHFYVFCTKFNVVSPFPASEHLMCCFAAFLADEGLAPQTGKDYRVGHILEVERVLQPC